MHTYGKRRPKRTHRKAEEWNSLMENSPQDLKDSNLVRNKENSSHFVSVQLKRDRNSIGGTPVGLNRDKIDSISSTLNNLVITPKSNSRVEVSIPSLSRKDIAVARKSSAVSSVSKSQPSSTQIAGLSNNNIEIKSKSPQVFVAVKESPRVAADKNLTKLLDLIQQTKPEPFQALLNKCRSIKKIGEATFSEVFSVEEYDSHLNIVMKVIPFGIDETVLVNGYPQPQTEHVFKEIYITHRLSKLSRKPSNFHFVDFKRAWVCQGKYPIQLLNTWDAFDDNRESENDRPDYFESKQMFVVILLGNAGQDLEHFPLKSFLQAESLLVQTILSLAAAENAYEFEHRDLHWGNILVKQSTRQTIEYSVHSKQSAIVKTNGIEATIIDFTLSRMKSQNSGLLYYLNLDDDSWFEGQGDYQFDIYRMMRDQVNGPWSSSCLKTNVMVSFHVVVFIKWIHYLSDKMLLKRKTKQGSKDLVEFKERILSYSSCSKLIYDPFIRSRIEFLNK